MPYIITEYRNGPWPHTSHQRDIRSQHAVATLKGVYPATALNISETCYHPSTRRKFQRRLAALPESGGTIGPLPDGTLIEVEQVSSKELRQRAGFGLTPKEIVDAFNATHDDRC